MLLRRRFALLSVLAFATTGNLLAEGPELSVEAGRWLTLAGLPAVLSADPVREHLTSGLTTTFLVRAEGLRSASGGVVGAARVDIRYEPWDEVFFVTAMGADGAASQDVSTSTDELNDWWAALRLSLLDLAAHPPYTARSVRLAMDVVPFSSSEQLDTQRWFSESVHRSGRGRAGSSQSVTEEEGFRERIFNLLFATSIQRRPIASFEWTVRPPAELARQ
jgi:hypothetical protein